MKKKLFLSGKLNGIILILIYVLIPQSVLSQKFTIPILPDTQIEVNSHVPMFTSQLQWIAAKKDSLHFPIVLHVGDLVDWDNTDQFIRASNGYNILDSARLDYAIALGNHDTGAVGEFSGSAAPGNTHTNVRITDKFNTYFPVNRFKAQKGRYEAGKSDNAYYTFQAGGLNWLVLTLELCARQAPVTWAATIIPQFPNYNVIILTHYHLNSSGAIATDNVGYGDLSPQNIYNQLISRYPNVRLVLSGHVGTSKYRNDIGVNGNHIYQLLQDYQGEDAGGGYIRLLEIDPAAGTMSAKMYSPYYNITKSDYSSFSFSGVAFVPTDIAGLNDNTSLPVNSLSMQLLSNSLAGKKSVEISSPSSKEATLSVFTLAGHRISSSKIKLQSNTKSIIELQKPGFGPLSSGVYFINVKQSGMSVSLKLKVN